MTDGSLAKTMVGHSENINDLIFNNDGSLVYSCSGDRTIKAWAFVTGIFLSTIYNSSWGLSNLHITSDNEKIFASYGSLIEYNLENNNIIHEYTYDKSFGPFCISSDGNSLIVAFQMEICIWNTLTSTLLKNISGVWQPIVIEISNDNNFVALGSTENLRIYSTIREWVQIN